MATSQFRVYRSIDLGAPVITGTSGSLIAALNAILVNGYGSTLSAGWSSSYTTVNTSGSCFRAPSGSGMYLSVEDVGSGSVRNARVMGIETPTTYNTGSAQFPSSSLPTPYYICRKSTTADLTPRPWVCFADAYTVYLLIQTGDNVGCYSGGLWFGDFYTSSIIPNLYNSFLIASEMTDTTTAVNANFDTLQNISQTANGQVLARSWTGTSGSVKFGKIGNLACAPTTQIFSSTIMYPNPVDNSLWMTPIYIADSPHTVGRMRGLYHSAATYTQVADGEQFSGSGDYAGRTFMFVVPGISNTVFVFETSNTLDTN